MFLRHLRELHQAECDRLDEFLSVTGNPDPDGLLVLAADRCIFQDQSDAERAANRVQHEKDVAALQRGVDFYEDAVKAEEERLLDPDGDDDNFDDR